MKELPKDLQRKMRELKPAKLRALLVDGTVQELIPHADHRKGWTHALDALRRLDWTRVDLVSPKGAILGSCDAVDAALAPAQAVELERGRPCCPTCGHSPLDARSIAKLVIDSVERAEERALKWQDEGVKTALQTNTATTASLTRAVEMLANVQQASIATVIQSMDALPPELPVGEGEGDPSDAMFNQLVNDPRFLLQLLGRRKPARPAPPAADKPPKVNGSSH